MARRRYPPEQIIGMLREAEVRLAEGGRVERYAGSWVCRSRVIIAGAVNMVG